MSSPSHFSRFLITVVSVVFLLLPASAAASAVLMTPFTKLTGSIKAWQSKITSCAPTSNVTPSFEPKCEQTSPQEGDGVTYTTTVVDDPAPPVSCADLTGTSTAWENTIAGDTVTDEGILHFDLPSGYVSYEACITTTATDSLFPVQGWSWNDNLGWVSFACDGVSNTGAPCGSISYGTKVDATTGLFSGYAWGDATGWLQFDWACPAGFSQTVCDDNRVKLNFADGSLSGYAWSDNLGWFNMDGVSVADGDISSLHQSSDNSFTGSAEVTIVSSKTHVLADCGVDPDNAYKANVVFFDSAGNPIDPEGSGYTVSVNDWTAADTVALDQVNAKTATGETVSSNYSGAECPLSPENPDLGYDFQPDCVKVELLKTTDGSTAYSKSFCFDGATPSACGNSVLEAGEECDDGNTVSSDGCSSSCTLENAPPATCGNGSVDSGEECDDGNTVSSDGCSSSCTTEPIPDCSGKICLPFYPVFDYQNFCVKYSSTSKLSYAFDDGKTTTKSLSADVYNASGSSGATITTKLFSNANPGSAFTFTDGTTDKTSTISSSYSEDVIISGDAGVGYLFAEYTVPDQDGDGTAEDVSYCTGTLPRYTQTGVGIPFFETRGTDNSATTGVATAKVTRDTLYAALKKVVGNQTGKTTDSTLQNGTGNDLDGSPRTVNDDASFLGGKLLYFSKDSSATSPVKVTFTDENKHSVDYTMGDPYPTSLASDEYITWDDPVTIVVDGGDVYIDNNLWGGTPIGIITLDKDGVGGHIYIDKDVTNIKAVMYADQFVTSYDSGQEVDSATGIPNFNTTPRSEVLNNQLYVVGSIVSGANTTDPVDSNSDTYFDDDELNVSDADKAKNFNWMREFKLYPNVTSDGNPVDYDGDGTIKDCSDDEGFPYLDPAYTLKPGCDGAWYSGGDLVIRSGDRIAAALTDDSAIANFDSTLPFYIRYQAPDAALPIFRSIGGGGAVAQ